jgi:asparagine synthase (glutamine-hydrolysing)
LAKDNYLDVVAVGCYGIMFSHFDVKGWIELDGKKLSERDIKTIISIDPLLISRFGGEFFIEWDCNKGRDHFGIIPGDCPPGYVVSNGQIACRIDPANSIMDLGEAIRTAVQLRSDEGVVALSGGVDSALVAKLAGKECIAVGMAGSHDILRAKQVASELGLSLETVILSPKLIEDALSRVLEVIPKVDPVNASIATTLFFVAEWAGSHGYRRILAGQGADELFGGYARYLETDTLSQDLEKDFRGLGLQLARDQAVAALHGTYFSLPYMDVRVVQAAKSIPAEKKVCEGIRKRPLREVAEHYLSSEIAYYEKKAMQYGSGVMKEIQRLARQRGYKGSIQEYLVQLRDTADRIAS